MHMTTGIARYMRMTRRPTSPPIPTRSPSSNELPIGRHRAETVEKAKKRAKGKAVGDVGGTQSPATWVTKSGQIAAGEAAAGHV